MENTPNNFYFKDLVKYQSVSEWNILSFGS